VQSIVLKILKEVFMEKEEIFEDLFRAIIDLDESKGREAANLIIEEKLDPLEGIGKGLSKGMEVIGERFEKLEIYLPELIMAGDVFNAAMEILEPEILARGKSVAKKGTIVIGTAKGDIHEIGKDIVAMLLKTAGFEVYNLGKDVPTPTFLQEAERAKADIIGVSALLTTTLLGQKDLIDLLKETGKRSRYIVMVGGGPTSQDWADKIGADGHGRTAKEAVSVALKLISKRRERRND